MPRITETVIDILRKADDAYPNGIYAPEDKASKEYAAFIQSRDNKWLIPVASKQSRHPANPNFPRFYIDRGHMGYKIAESGRDILDEYEGNLSILNEKEGREVIINVITNIHMSGNENDAHLTAEEITKFQEMIEKSEASTIGNIIKNWLPTIRGITASEIINTLKAILVG